MTAPKNNKRGRAALVVVLCLLALCLAAGGTVYGLLSRLLRKAVEEDGVTTYVLSWKGNALAALVAIAVAVAVYLVLLVALRCLSRDDLALMPKGDKIARLLRLD